ncbi:Glycoside hydrolase, 38 vacuolar alpha mannosidase [Coemansia spiralis]|uniref:Alpha-mannosidase n=2 Tax=Coemansia TaxID=4863 RepID=A0A9W8G323_9FUNG|nr:galactose mutarotase-like domain-containing protein [Coemansia spiralis]KAJ1989397.1 Glycoside hydrolase, 38 vacuolar alpha mannosidase [Coemansia umbellata]KAJ2622361.1 Glycoside hydrolase, 38 vacuolar alpha mannosidase [Coemansia sp. RSA 1358]KAJ2677840.1 Glycoside hydrolase, 38 vacuolar alpha mannosidase [Coemansia spiralis]
MDPNTSYLQKHPNVTSSRVSNFLNKGQWEETNIHASLYDSRVSGEPHVKMEWWPAPGLERPTFAHAAKQEFSPISTGHTFGPGWATHWVRATIKIPKEFEGKQVRFLFDPECEAMVWSAEGEALQGITGASDSGCHHVDFILTNKAKADEGARILYLEIACNGLFGNPGPHSLIAPPNKDRRFSLREADLVVLNEAAWAMLHDMGILLDAYKTLPASSPRAWQALSTANDMVNVYEPNDKASINRALEISKKFFASRGGEANHQVYAIGNCHIDTAWLWPYDETKRKVARSWSTQLDYMDRYPEYKFAASQAQQFEWLQTLYPALFKRVQEKAKTGQFIPIGGTWIEMDCNIPSGESLARQFLLGQKYFEKHFNQRSKVFWLPDTFGYSSQLPQIVRLSGAEYFFTQKLSWNNINKFPHTTFRWIGLDGSHILTHMAPAETYTANATASQLISSVARHKDISYTNESLYLYGNGDGGGGPLEDMIERLDRMKDVDGLPRVKHAHPNEFYEHVDKTNKGLVTWKGELYFELHRGTYTSQAKTKKFNRQSEFLLRDVEMLSVMAKSIAHGFAYPSKEIERLWKLVCLNQFHDVIPGTSIEIVYEDTDAIYADVVQSATAMKQDALIALFNHVSLNSVDEATGMLFVNTTAWPRTEVVAVPGLDHAGIQQVRKQDNAALVIATSVPELGVSVVDLTDTGAESIPVTVFKDTNGDVVLENLYVTARIGKHGQLVSLWDKRDERELIPDNKRANVFYLHDDIPLFWDAWDIEIYNLEKKAELPATKVVIVDEGPLVASVCIEIPISEQSKLRQWVSLSAISPRLDFACDVDWHESRKCLKVSFTWDIYNDMATYETQYGVIQRPTHRNTTWDMAKFEVCAHKFVDLSEYGYGVALLNDCKYGYSTLGNTMSMTLLRSPKAPDANCDMGNHTFRYAIYPHKGAFGESDVVQEAYQFNIPLVQLPVDYEIAANAADSAGATPYFSLAGAPNVVLDTVKAAEDNPNDVIVRMYEAYGGHARATLTTKLNVSAAQKTNILEEKMDNLKISPAAKGSKGKSVSINIKPFEIVTVKFIIKS